jgi:alpha-tubulin suppressor-like RCC1 family protein
VVQVAAGAQHSCALHDNGQVSCWGLAESIVAGGAEILRPRQIAGISGAQTVAAGAHLSCAITATRTVQCWGNQQLTVADRDGVPIAKVVGVALGSDYGCVVGGDGTHCWGKNDFGQLGQPLSVTDSAAALLARAPEGGAGPSFVGTGIAAITVTRQPAGDQLCAWGRNATALISASGDLGVQTTPQCRMVADVLQLTVGDTHACVRYGAGTFTCWGERYYGQLGQGGVETADVPPPGPVTSLAAPVAKLAAGVSHTCALLTDGQVVCFGRNNLGQVGPGAATSEEEVRTPAVVTGFAGKVIAIGAGSTAQHTCAVIADGSVQCWGSDGAGQLGDGVTGLDPARKSNGPVTVEF